jgi:hypothetical protein
MRRHANRIWALPAISALATVLVAATVDPGDNWARLRAMPSQQRQRLVENLQKFDLVYSADQQRSLRDLDRRIHELEPARQAQYLAALRRYRNWLDGLPETLQDAVKEKAPGERMEFITKLAKDHPVTHATTARFLQFVDVGDYSPFELAAIFQVWHSMTPSEQQQVEKLPAGGPRRKAFLQKGEARRVAASLKRKGFDELKWVTALETFAENRKIGFLLQELKAKDDARPGEILRRQAINLHFLESERPSPVDPDRLADFLASFPPWLQTCFDHHSPDEARRRLTVVYRLVHTPEDEIKEASKHATPPASARTAPGASPGAKNPAAKRSSGTDVSPY